MRPLTVLAAACGLVALFTVCMAAAGTPATPVELPDAVTSLVPSVNAGFAGLGLLALVALSWRHIAQIKRGHRADADAINAYRESLELKDKDNDRLRSEINKLKGELKEKDDAIAVSHKRLFDEVTGRQDRFGEAQREMQREMAELRAEIKVANSHREQCDAELEDARRNIAHMKHLLVSKGVVMEGELALTIG